MFKKIFTFAILLSALNLAVGQGSQLPKYTVSTLPPASTLPKYVVQVIDGATATDCTTGGGAFNVVCTSHLGVWVTINATGGTDADAVHYNPTTAQYFMIGDSRLINDSATPSDMTVTAVSMDGTTITLTGTNTPSVGTYVIPWWEPTFSPYCLSGAFGPILTSTSTQVTMAQSGSYCTGAQTGTGGNLAVRNYTVPALTQDEPFFKGHGTVQLLAQSSYGGGTVYDWDTQFSTLLSPKLTACLSTAGPCFLTVSLGFDDLFADSPDSCSTVGTLEGSVTTTGSFRKLFNEVHQLGNVQIVIATEPTRMASTVYCTNTPQDMIVLNQWLVTLSGAGAETSGYLDYADSIIDTATAMGSPSNGNFSDVHYSSAGGKTFADALNSGMSSQGSWNLGQPASNGPNILTGPQLIRNPSGISTGCQLSFADDGSITADWCLQDYVGIAALQMAGGWASSWRWNNSTMYQQMPSNGGYCVQNGTDGPYADSSDTCLWRESAGVWDLGGNTWKDAGGTLKLANVDLTVQTTDPSSPINGQIWYNSTSGLFKFYQGGSTATLGGGSSITWPASTDLIISNGTNSPAGLAPVNGDCVVGAGGAWTAGSCAGSGGGITQITGPSSTVTGNVTFNGSGVSQSGTTFTFTGGGGGSGSGLFASLINIPTITSSGFTTAWNQSGTFTAVNSSIGITLNDSAATGASEGIISAYPGVAFTETILVSAPIEKNYTTIGFVILSTTSGANETFGLSYSSGDFTNTLEASATHSSSPGVYVATDGNVPVSGMQWLRYQDDGTNVKYSVSGDGVIFYPVYGPVAKSSTYLGSSGYNYLGISMSSYLANAGGTIMSLTRTTP